MNRFFVFIGVVLIFASGFVLNSCEDDVDLLAPYKSTPVIYGVLDYSTDTQFVRINRTYLGAGDANIYAQIKDSVEYDPSEVVAWLIKKDQVNNGFDRLDSIQLQYITRPSRDPGAFFNQDVGFYYTDEDLFTEDELSDIVSGSASRNSFFYELRVEVRGQEYVADTDFPSIKEGDINYPLPIGTPNVPRPEYYKNSLYQTQQFRYTQRNRVKRYQSLHRIIYDYNTADGDLVTDQISDFELGVKPGSENGMGDDVTFNAEGVYEFLGNVIKSNPDIKKVRIKEFQYRLTGASESLDTYVEVANPISDFTPVLSTYTNLSNGAIGILGARATAVRSFYVSEPSLQEFNEGELTIDEDGNPCYCVEGWNGTNFNCTPTQDNCP